MICFLCHFNPISIRGSEYVAESATGRHQWVGVEVKAAIESGYISTQVRRYSVTILSKYVVRTIKPRLSQKTL
jgi:hypothetical protein